MLTPVPPGAATQLRTLRRVEERGAPAGTLILHAERLWLREGRLPAAPPSRRGRGGTDLAAVATFREVAGLSGGDNLVSFEPFTRPGCHLASPEGGSGGQACLLHRDLTPLTLAWPPSPSPTSTALTAGGAAVRTARLAAHRCAGEARLVAAARPAAHGGPRRLPVV